MTPEQWARVKDLFHAALAQDEKGRRAFVAEASAGDAAVCSEVERLLDADLEAAAFIEHPGVDSLLSGRVVGHYEVGRLLGTGGMGRVYAARDIELGRDVALKVASVSSEDAQSRLRREAQHASRLSHPHLCQIYDVARDDGQLFVVMELVEGQSLADLVQERPLSIDEATRYGSEIADALAHAHEHGVTHRDLKSTNVMITPRRGAKVLDFGLARRLDTHQIDALSYSQRSLTAEGMIAGTLPYLPPELLRGQRGDQRADIWALGVLLYEMVTGRRPFTGTTGFELSAAILHQPPDALPPHVPASLSAIIQRCLEKDPDNRYQHASDLHLALQEVKVPAKARSMKIPAIPKRLSMAVLLLVIALAIAATALLGPRASRTFSNMQGYSLLQQGAFEQALTEFQGVVDGEPNDANAWDSLGEGYLANGMPEKALEAYSRALALEPGFESSLFGKSLALAALGRYDEVFKQKPTEFRAQAFLLSRVGRYREAAEVLDAGRREVDDPEVGASALLTSAWLLIERKDYARALGEIGAAETALGQAVRESRHPLLVLADLLRGVAEIRAGRVQEAKSRIDSQKARHDSTERVEVNWLAALEGEVALAQRDYHRAMSSFYAARTPAWQTLGHDTSTVLSMNVPSRDGLARLEVSRGNRMAAIEEYRRLTSRDDGTRSSAVLEPGHVLALARLLDDRGDAADARLEYDRFLKLWANADEDSPELTEARRAVARLDGKSASGQ